MKLSVLASLVPGAGTQSSARSPLEGSAGHDFGALLGGMAKDASAGTLPALVAGVPPTVEATGSAGASVEAAPVPGNGEEGETGSRQKSSSSTKGEPQLSDVSFAAPAVAGVEGASGAPGVTSLLSLATRAAEPARSGAAMASTASDPTVAPTVASEAKVSSSVSSAKGEAQASGRVVRRTSKPGDDQAGGVADTVAPTPVGALVAAIGVPAPAIVPNAADITQPSSGTDALVPGPPPSPEAGSRSVMPSDVVALPTADDASGSSLAFPTIAAPTAAPGETGNASVPSTATSPVDAAILPGTVSVESYLGFDRSTSVGGKEVRRAVATDVSAATGASDPNDSRGLLTSAMPRASVLVPALAGSNADVANSSAPRSASTESSASNGAVHLPSPSTKPTTDQPNPSAADATAPAPAALATAIVLPTPQAASPVTQQVAEGVAGLAATVVPDETAPDTKVAPARTMALQLSPAGLGTLIVRLHVAGRALDIQLEASDGRTAALIDRDRDALAGALRGKDYQLQTLTVTTHDATMPGGTHAEHGTEPRSADTGSSDAGSPGRSREESAGGRSGGDGSSREAPGREPRPTRRPADEASLERGGSSLFV